MITDRSVEHRLSELERQLADLRTGRGAISGDGTNTFLRGQNFQLTGGSIQIFDGSGNLLAELDTDGVGISQADGSVLVQLDGTGIRLNDGSGTKLIDLTTSGLQAYEADGSTLVILDGSKLRFNRSDGTRQLEITPAGGMKFYESDGSTVITTLDGSGLQVGSDVVIDSTGLEVIGGMVTPVWPFTASDSWNDATISSDTQVASITIDAPDWVEELHLMSIATGEFANEASALRLFTLRVTNDDGGASEDTVGRNHEAADGGGSGVGTVAFSVANRETIPLSPAGRSVIVSTDASVSVSSQSTNAGSLSVIGFGVRLP